MPRPKQYLGTSIVLQEALQLAYDLRAEVKKRVRKDLKRNINTRIVGTQELDRYILQCNPKAPRQRRDALWYETAMQRLIDTVLVLRSENALLRREVGRAVRDGINDAHVQGEDA